jgi:riboflavin kinase/FMN adenylyltransferase
MTQAAALLGRPYSHQRPHAIHGAKLGRELGFRTLNLRLRARRAGGHGHLRGARAAAWPRSRCRPWPAWACAPRWKTPGACCWRCTAWQWPEALGTEAGYGRCVQVELAAQAARRAASTPSLEALREGIAQDVADARAWFGR